MGEVVKDKGVMSTSTDIAVSNDFGGGITLYKVILPRGTKALHDNWRENEITLPPNTYFRVLKKKTNLEIRGSDYSRISRYYEVELMYPTD